MATPPPRRRRRFIAAGGALTLVAASAAFLTLRTEPAKADYLTAGDAKRAVTRATLMAGSDQVVGVVLARNEAIVRVLRSGRVHSWAIRPGREAVEIGSAALTQALAPMKPQQLQLPQLVERIRADEVGAACNPEVLKAEIGVTAFPTTLTHVWCLDGARHSWLGAGGAPIADVDPRKSDGMVAGVADLRRLTGARHVSYLAVRYGGTDAGLDLEVPGACGDLAGCDAVVASRRLHVESREPALQVRQAPARLNYAAMIDLDTVDPVRLHATIEHLTQTRKGVDWWRSLTVTLYQRPGQQPALEFKQGSTVFWTDLDGTETHF
ncbi:hypothetical protein [Mariniluteicoccus flavus]